jgi:hypothetical protein
VIRQLLAASAGNRSPLVVSARAIRSVTASRTTSGRSSTTRTRST